MADDELPEKSKRPFWKKKWIFWTILALVVIVTVLACTLSLLLNNGSGSGKDLSADSDSKRPHWPGWDGINHLVTFGDSMTSTNFNWLGEQPSRANPIGNPAFPGLTSANGPNWVGFMTATYNESFIKTVDLGGGGATVDEDILRSNFPLMRSFSDQVNDNWLPNYVDPKPSSFPWTADDTLFAIFFGLNDVRGAYFNNWDSRGKTLNEDIDRYVELVGDLYRNGARNFLMLKLSPFQKAPWTRNNTDTIQEVKGLVEGYNTNLTEALSQFSDANTDASVFLFDTYDFFNEILDDPCSYKETCPLQDTTSYCPAYEDERNDQYRDDPECPYSIDKYFWINAIHCGFRVHKAFARGIVDYLNEIS